MTVQYLTGDSLEILRTLPDNSVDLSTCSPPFLALRNYNDLEGQWGAEGTPAAFLSNLLDLAVETRRVLTPHGSLAWELGDTYSGSGGAGGDYTTGGMREGQNKFKAKGKRKSHRRDRAEVVPQPNRGGYGWPLSKSLTGVPTLFAWSLAYGRNLLAPEQTFEPWRIRNVIVWARSNPPVGALGDKVRPATSYITVATPSKNRWFDLDAVRHMTERHAIQSARPEKYNKHGSFGHDLNRNHNHGKSQYANAGNPAGAPPNDYWTDEYDVEDLAWLVNSQGSKLAHYAMWPPKLAERLILSMCPREVCASCGEPRRRLIDRPAHAVAANLKVRNGRSRDGAETGPRPSGFHRIDAETIGWSECDCTEPVYRPGVVLDPFAGTGTTLSVADVHGRDAIGIDLDPNNPTLYERRHAEVKRSLFGTKPEIPGSISLFDETVA